MAGPGDMDDFVVDADTDGPAGATPPPPPPPPPPSGKRPGASSVFAMAPVSAPGLPEVLTRLEKFAAVLVGLEREVTDLHQAAKKLEITGISLPGGAAATAPLPEAREERERELEALKASAKKLTEDNERLEGEVSSLKIFRDQTRDKIKKAVAEIVDLRLDPEAEEAVRAIVVDRDRLQEEKSKLEADLARMRGEATKRLTALKNDLETVKKEHDTTRMQKDNLMRQLRTRDEEAEGKHTVTLEDITSSEIFRTMLSNIRKTSRQEITILHDAIASIRAIDPKAYDTVLEIIGRAFKKAQVENPLATLPRG